MTEKIIIAFIGFGGAIIGSVATIAGNFFIQWYRDRAERQKEKPARDLLIEMLNHKEHKWRKLDTLQHVIGADEEKTKRLLLEVGARASEDGKPLWALKTRVPLNKGNQSADV